MDLNKVKENIKELLDKIRPRFEFQLPAALTDKIDPLADRFLSRFPEEKRRYIAMGIGVFVIFSIILLICVAAASPGRTERNVQGDTIDRKSVV